jgi:hypothetical protein
MFLFRAGSEYCGAVETTGEEILESAFELITLDQEDLLASNETGSCGVLLEYYMAKYVTGPVAEYRLLVWGEECVHALRD